MTKLKFRLTEYEKYNSKRIGILGAQFKIGKEDKIVEVNNTSYDYKKVVLRLSPEKADVVKEFEDEVNQYLEENDVPKVTLRYGNCIYPKVRKNVNVEKLKTIKFKSVYVNDEDKSFPQLWLEN